MGEDGAVTERDAAAKSPEAAVDPGGSDADGVVTVLFLDLVRYTSLTEIHGDSIAADAASAMEEVARDSMRASSRLVKTVGDGVLVTADSPGLGLLSASFIVEGLHELGKGLDARGGLAHGPLVQRNGDVFGTTVNLAARLAEYPEAGRLAMTRPVAEAAGEANLGVSPRGLRSLKGFRSPVEVFVTDPCVHEGEWITDPVCGMRLRAEDAVARTTTPDGSVGFCSQRCARLFDADVHGGASITDEM